jgi:hypothetical protein
MGYVRAHWRRGGEYVHGHYRRNPGRNNLVVAIGVLVVVLIVVAVLI